MVSGSDFRVETNVNSFQENKQKSWTVEDSEQLYRIHQWGNPYFSMNSAGRITVSPKGDRGGSLDLFELVEGLRQRNIGLPLLVRFTDILADRIERLNACFDKAIARYNYPGTYQGVFPVKCNQHRHLVEKIVEFGAPHNFGLEAGSKPELIIAFSCLPASQRTLVVCNGYKDAEYMEIAMLSQRLGHRPIIVLEQLEEVSLAIETAQKLNIVPILGVRAKLQTKGIGRWGGSSGDRAKFGLNVAEIMQAVGSLREAEMLDCLQLLHFHIGSQISAISAIKDAIREASQIYVELLGLGANMQYLDVGGGLGVDYDGSKTKFYASKNYNMQNYANDIVAEVKEACEERNASVPTLVSESGRAIASAQSVLIFDVLGSSDVPTQPPAETITDNHHLILRNLYETYQSIQVQNYQEAYNDAIQFKEEAISLFNFGYLSLHERALAEQLFWACCHEIQKIARQQDYVPDDLENLEKILASIYYVNLSIFRSAPDSWAIDQLFPILPIHRLNEEPTQRATLADLTCDSDGKIDRFIDLQDVKHLLELHPLESDRPYYLGMFLGGAYQEIMGNFHNLFGNTNVVHISVTPKGYNIDHVVKGDTIADVLEYVQYDPEDLLENIRQQSEQALRERRIGLQESQKLLQNLVLSCVEAYEKGLRSYTYLNSHQNS